MGSDACVVLPCSGVVVQCPERRRRSAGFVDHGLQGAADFCGDALQGGIRGEGGEDGRRRDHADAGLALFGVDRDAAGQRHVEAQIDRQDALRLLRIADLENPALLCEILPFAAQGLADVVDVEDTEVVALDGGFQIGRSLFKRFVAIDDAVGGQGADSCQG